MPRAYTMHQSIKQTHSFCFFREFLNFFLTHVKSKTKTLNVESVQEKTALRWNGKLFHT